jgi:ArsR family transcriptional regulator
LMADRISIASVFKVLGDQTRGKIIRMLASNADEVFCVSDIAKKIGISQPAVSQHIRVLKSIGLLVENRRGFRVFYTIDLDVFLEYKNRIDEMFKKAFKKCPHDFPCSQCPNNKC